jgi:processive 1,2-diacylglycerol beta-glucosyltransferase
MPDQSAKQTSNSDIERGALISDQIVILSAGIGAGHNYAAEELQFRLVRAGYTASIHDILEVLPFFLRTPLRSLYAPTVNRAPWIFTLLMLFFDIAPQWIWWLFYQLVAVDTLRNWTAGARVIVTTHAIATQAAGYLQQQDERDFAIAAYHCDAGMVKIGFHLNTRLNFVLTSGAVGHCSGRGHDAIVVTPLVREEFTKRIDPEKLAMLRAELEIPVSSNIVLLAAGSLGIGNIARSVRDICAANESAWVLVLCGRNHALQQRLQTWPRVIALGWREDVAELLAMSDIMVHNAGGMAVWEAQTMGLPLITYNALPGHGRINAMALERAGFSAWPRDRRALTLAIGEALSQNRDSDASGLDRGMIVDTVADLMRAKESSAGES